MVRGSKRSGAGLMQEADPKLFLKQRTIQNFISIKIESRAGWCVCKQRIQGVFAASGAEIAPVIDDMNVGASAVFFHQTDCARIGPGPYP